MKKNILLALSGIFLLAFGFLAGFYLATNKFTRLLTTQKQEVSEEFEYPSFGEDFFYASIFFGENIGTRQKIQALPEDKGFLKGKFIYNKQPAPGITFDITLNDSFKRESVTTDENGGFLLSLPPGKWLINSIECKSWKNSPEGEFILVSGDTPWIGTNYLRAGKEVIVTDTVPKKEHIVLTINPRINIIWPKGSAQKQEATIANSKISWDPYPDVDKYRITISRVTREGLRTTSYHPIIDIETSKNTILPLNDLPHRKDSIEKEEYSVSVQALRQSGELLSESYHSWGSFMLTDGNVLIESNIPISNLNQEKINQIYSATKAMSAVETLIDEKMLDEAEILLKKFEDYGGQGEKELLMGYLSAAKGNCDEAKKYFDLALQKGQKCISEKYRLNCK
ncbi:MAG TPA: hypothetical protein VGB72_04965 [Acidobacteriota bacterium]